MKYLVRILIYTSMLFLNASCDGDNILSDGANTSTDAALFVDAQTDVDASEWDAAISIIENQMSASYQARADVIQLRADAYAGKCGLDFLTLVSSLEKNPSTKVFEYFMAAFESKTLSVASCGTAVTLMKTLGTVSTRTTNQNIFMAILGISWIGTTLSSELDQTTPDGLPDSTFSVCNNYSGGVATDGYSAAQIAAGAPAAPSQPDHFLTDTEIKQIVAGVGLIFENISALTTLITAAGQSNSILTTVASVKSQCEALAGTGNCTITDPTLVSGELVYIYRLLLDTSTLGVGSCDTSETDWNASDFCCPALLPVTS